MGRSFDEEVEKRAIEIACKEQMERHGDVDVEAMARAVIKVRNEREEQRRAERERERSQRSPYPPYPPYPPRHGPLGQPVIDNDGTYL